MLTIFSSIEFMMFALMVRQFPSFSHICLDNIEPKNTNSHQYTTITILYIVGCGSQSQGGNPWCGDCRVGMGIHATHHSLGQPFAHWSCG